MNQRPGMHVLIIDDCQADTKLIQLWLRDSPAVRSIELVCEGRKALQRVRNGGADTGNETAWVSDNDRLRYG